MTAFVRDGAHREIHLACFFLPSAAPDSTPCPRLDKERKWRRRSIAGSRSMGKRCADCHADPHRGSAGPNSTSVTPPPVSGACSRGPREPSSRATTPKSGCVHTPICPGTKTMSGHRGARVPAATPRPSAPVVIAPTRPRVTPHSGALRGHGTAAAFDPEPCRVCHPPGGCVQCPQNNGAAQSPRGLGTVHGFAAGSFANENCYVCHRRADCLICHHRP